MKRFGSKTQKIGKKAEEAVVRYLKSQEFHIIEENYTQHRIGEIDIITKKESTIHFIEVKSIRIFVPHETSVSEVIQKSYNPAENLTKEKYQKIYKTAMHFLKNTKVSYETFVIDLYIVYFDEQNNKFYIKIIENVIVS